MNTRLIPSFSLVARSRKALPLTAVATAIALVGATVTVAIATTPAPNQSAQTYSANTLERALETASNAARVEGQVVTVDQSQTPGQTITVDPHGTFTATVTMPTPVRTDDAEPKPMPAAFRSTSWLTVIEGQDSSTPNDPGTADGKQALRVGKCPRIINLPDGQAMDGNCGNVTTARSFLSFSIAPLLPRRGVVPTIFDNATVTLTQTRASYCNDYGVALYASAAVTGKEKWPGPAVGKYPLSTVASRAGCSPSTPPALVAFGNVRDHLRTQATNNNSVAHFALFSTVENNDEGWRRFDSSSPTLSYQFAFPPTHAKNLTVVPGKQCGGIHYMPALPQGQTVRVQATADDPLGLDIGMDFAIGEPTGKPIQKSPTSWKTAGKVHDWATNFTFVDKKRYRITASTKGVRTSSKDPNNIQYLRPAGAAPSILVEANTTPPSKPVTVSSEAFPDIETPGPVAGKSPTFSLKADPADQIVAFTYAWNAYDPVNPHDGDCNTSRVFAPGEDGRAVGGFIPAVNGIATLPMPATAATGVLKPGTSALKVQGFDAAGQTTNTVEYMFYVSQR